MGKRGRLLGSGLGLAAIVGLAFTGAISVGATTTSTPAPIVIGVDNASPAGHNFEYTDFFPRGLPIGESGSATRIRDGNTVAFKWGTAPDGFHTATLLKEGVAPGPTTWGADHPLVVPEATPDEAGLQINPDVLRPSQVGCGFGPQPACDFDGVHEVSSGAIPTASGAQFRVKIFLDVSQPTTIHFVCLIHPGMQGALTVLPNQTGAAPAGSTQAELDTAAAAQYASDTSGALAAESLANTKAVTNNGDGTHTITMTAGTAAAHVEVAEMLPTRVELRPGDKVKWVTSTAADIHTVTFPKGAGSNGVDPLQVVCEGAGTTDTPAPEGPPTFGCASFAEFHFVPQPQGPTAIATTTTVATSGIIASPPAPFPTNYTFSFPSTGTFAYQCRIHDHMIGTVVVNPAQAVQAPPAATPPVLAQTGRPAPRPWVQLLLGVLAIALGLLLLAVRRGLMIIR
jgi:plastocyanin